MPKLMQSIVVLSDPSHFVWNISWKAKNIYMNRLCINEDDAFELSGVYGLGKSPYVNRRSKTWEQHNKGKGILVAIMPIFTVSQSV